MSNKKTYEEQLAHRLEQLEAPAPAETHWPAMKALLDRELPEGAAGFRWIYLLLLLLAFTGAGWYFWPTAQNNAAGIPATQPAIASPGNAQAAPATAEPVPSTRQAPDKAATAEPKYTTPTGTVEPAVLPEGNTKESLDITEKSIAAKTAATPAHKELAVTTETRSGKAEKRSGKLKSGTRGIKYTSTKQPVPLPQLQQDGELVMEDATTNTAAVVPIGASREMLSGNALISNRFAPELNTAYGEQLMQFRPFRSRFPEETERTKALRNRTVGTGDNKNFVFGLTLPLTVAISDQKTSAYNFSGGANKISDYLPSPHVQYHLNDKSFLQTELQFYAPQYIRPALLYQQSQLNASGAGNNLYKTRSVYTEKLYYFNLPVSGYYSPFKNFYLGTGMQYSRLLSGIAHVQETTGPAMNPSSNNLVVNDYFSRFGRDTLSAALNPNEFRVLLDANYYWKKFTMGFRYNQALGNYISMQVNGFNPYYTDRNKSFLFYLRYNLWENHKAPKPAMAVKPH